jgi:hypothetical protein
MCIDFKKCYCENERTSILVISAAHYIFPQNGITRRLQVQVLPQLLEKPILKSFGLFFKNPAMNPRFQTSVNIKRRNVGKKEST